MKIVFLHGIGDGDPNKSWLRGLNQGLQAAGHLRIDERDVIAPSYASILATKGISAKIPDVTYRPKDDRKSRREFERRQAAVQRFIQREDTAAGFGFNKFPKPWMDVAVDLGVQRLRMMDLDYVENYVNNEGVRGAVLRCILDQLPVRREIILIGHSLGSVIAIDLLDHLPEKLHVRRFITAGSPANSPSLYRGRERLLKKFPYARVDDWTNIFNHRDIVTSGRGLASVFPGAQDFALNAAGFLVHGAEEYLRDPVVTKLVAQVLYPSKEPVPARYDLAIRLSDKDLATLVRLRFAHAVGKHIKDEERRTRYMDALKLIQDDLAAQAEQIARNSVPLPSEWYDVIDGKVPPLPERFDLRDVVSMLVSLAATNFIEPYEIDTGDAQKEAIGDMLLALGMPRKHRVQIISALEDVEAALNRSGGLPWGRIGIAAAGLALLAAGPVGLAMAAPASAFGAAAITGGLAAFGPGGMIGGLATLGGLAASGAGLAAGAAFNDTSPERVMLNVTQLTLRVAAARAHQLLQLPEDTQLWGQLTLLETQIAAELNRLEPFSDPGCPRIKQLHAALTVIRKLLRFLIDKRLGQATAINGDGTEIHSHSSEPAVLPG